MLPIQQKKEVAYACIVALLFYQNQARNIDRVNIFFMYRKKLILFVQDREIKGEMEQIELLPLLSCFSHSRNNLRKLLIYYNKKITVRKCILWFLFGILY